MKDYVRITLRIPADLHQVSLEMAKKMDRSLNGQIVAMIRTGTVLEQQKGNAPTAATGEALVKQSKHEKDIK